MLHKATMYKTSMPQTNTTCCRMAHQDCIRIRISSIYSSDAASYRPGSKELFLRRLSTGSSRISTPGPICLDDRCVGHT